MERKFIAIQSLSGSKGASCFWADIDENGWVNGETPIEDFGMFMVLDREIDEKAAGRIFLALLGHAEREEPEVIKEINQKEYLFRPIGLPQLLTEEDYSIYKTLVKSDLK